MLLTGVLLFCPHLSIFVIEYSKNTRNELARPVMGTIFLVIITLTIRECSSTLYVGLARTVPPTNTNFRLMFLLTRLQGAVYEDLPV